MKRLPGLYFLFFFLAGPLCGQQPTPAPVAPPPVTKATPEFAQAADEVFEAVSRIVELPIKSPLKKSIRTREEIRSFVLRQLKDDERPEKRYADQRVLEKLGLIPKGFDLDAFLVELLTEQIAGLYDPKGKEFFIADWIAINEQKMVMAHELVHALHDQHFNLDEWLKAARPNDDAVAARDAVAEGAAVAGMIDYLLRDKKTKVRDLPDLETFIRGQMTADPSDSPQLGRAPMYLRDSLLFPYLSGTTFAQRVLRAGSGWADFNKVFENPPVSTQQILHPEMYLAGVTPRPVSLPDLSRILPRGWKKLDENLVGEFGLRGILKQYLGEERANKMAAAWAGDLYAIYEQEKTKQALLLVRLRLDGEESAARFFGQYSELLELKYATRGNLLRRPNFFAFESEEGGVFLYCNGVQCLTVEGAERRVFDRIIRAMEWPAAPSQPRRAPAKANVAAAAFRWAGEQAPMGWLGRSP